MTPRATLAAVVLALLGATALAGGGGGGGKGAPPPPGPSGPGDHFKDEVLVKGARGPLTGVEVTLESYEKVEWKSKGGALQSKPAADVISVTYGDVPKDMAPGMEAFRAGRWTDAETSFRGILSAVDAGKARKFWDARGAAWIGECRRRSAQKEKNAARYKEAVESFRESLTKDPKSPLFEMVSLGLADSLAGGGDWDAAFKSLDEFKKTAGDAARPVWEGRSRLARARLLERKGEVGGALSEFTDLATFAANALAKAAPDSGDRKELEALKTTGLVSQGWALYARAEKTKSAADLDAARKFFEGLASASGGSTAGKAASANGLGGILLLEGKPWQAVEKFLDVEVTMFSVPEEVARSLWYKSLAYDKLGMAAGREQALKDLVEFYPGSEWASRAR